MKLQDYDFSVRVVEVTSELKELAERDEVRPPKYNGLHYICNECNRIMEHRTNYCAYCGQRLR